MSVYLLRPSAHCHVSVRSRRKDGNPTEYMLVLTPPTAFGERANFRRVRGDLTEAQVQQVQQMIDRDMPVALLYNDLQQAVDAFAHLAGSVEVARSRVPVGA